MKKLLVSLFSLLIHFSSNAYAVAMTANDLQKICIASDSESKVACKFYILGIAQGLNLGMAVADGEIQGGRPCVPDDVSASTLVMAVKIKMGQDLMAYPEDRKLDASGVVGAGLIKTFPCKK